MRYLLLFMLACLTACVAEDAYDDVSLQQTSIEEAAVDPAPAADLWVTRECQRACESRTPGCLADCRGASWCDGYCEGEQDICRGNCLIWGPDNSGSLLVAPSSSAVHPSAQAGVGSDPEP